jgi:hypothetical protein
MTGMTMSNDRQALRLAVARSAVAAAGLAGNG